MVGACVERDAERQREREIRGVKVERGIGSERSTRETDRQTDRDEVDIYVITNSLLTLIYIYIYIYREREREMGNNCSFPLYPSTNTSRKFIPNFFNGFFKNLYLESSLEDEPIFV